MEKSVCKHPKALKISVIAYLVGPNGEVANCGYAVLLEQKNQLSLHGNSWYSL